MRLVVLIVGSVSGWLFMLMGIGMAQSVIGAIPGFIIVVASMLWAFDLVPRKLRYKK